MASSGSRILSGGRNCRASGSFSCTSKSKSSGPASGRRRYGRASMPGAAIVETLDDSEGTETRIVDGVRRARCARALNAKFLRT